MMATSSHLLNLRPTSRSMPTRSKPHDAWSTPLRLEPTGWSRGREHYFRVRSAGPDQQFDTADDLAVFLEARTGTVFPSERGGSITVQMEHDRGPVNGLAEITGTVNDASGAVIPQALVTLQQIGQGAPRKTTTNAEGTARWRRSTNLQPLLTSFNASYAGRGAPLPAAVDNRGH